MSADGLLNFNFYQNSLTIAIIFIELFLILIFFAHKKSDVKVITFLYIWHTLFSTVYFLYTLNSPADAKGYYFRSLSIDKFEFNLGTKFVTYVTHLFSQGLDANYLNVTLIFNFFGSIGLILLYLSVKNLFLKINKYWFFMLLIPSMSFWSAGLGKDSIAFFCVCLFLYAVSSNKKYNILMSFSFFLMFMIRPHIAFIMLASYSVYFIIRAKIHIVFKLVSLPAIFLGILFSLRIVQEYVGIEDVSLDNVGDYVDQRQGYNQGGGSSLDIASMSYPMQMFTYVFRPLPFEASSAVALVTSLENTILLFLFIYILFKSKFNFRPFIHDKNLWLFTYIFLTCTILAMTTANLGIATRQKWMFMPVLLYLLIYSFHNYKLNKSRIYQ